MGYYWYRWIFGAVLLTELTQGILTHALTQALYLGLLTTLLGVWIGLEAGNWLVRRAGTVGVPAAAIAAVVGAVIIDASGNISGWYDEQWWYDLIVHSSSGLAGAVYFYYFWHLVTNAWPLGPARVMRSYLAVTSVVLFGVLFEIFEWAADVIYAQHLWLGDAHDTVIDLIFNLLGAAIGVGVAWAWGMNQTRTRDEK